MWTTLKSCSSQRTITIAFQQGNNNFSAPFFRCSINLMTLYVLHISHIRHNGSRGAFSKAKTLVYVCN